MQRLFFIDGGQRLVDPHTGPLDCVEDPLALIRNGLFASHSMEELAQCCPGLARTLGSLRFESAMLVQVARPGRSYGYLVFCPEIRTMHIWQESECAAAFFLARMLAVYLEQQSKE